MQPLTFTALTFSILLAGCASTSEKAGRDHLTDQVGIYPPPSAGTQPIRIGVPAFTVSEGVEGRVAPLAADQITSLAANTQRFEVIERAQLDQLLKEQNQEGIVTAGEIARPAQIRGVELLLLGKVTSLRVKQSRTGSSFNPGLPVHIPFVQVAAGIEKADTEIKVECGVDLRLVDPTTGKTIVADFSEFDRTDNASALGLQIFGDRANADASLQVSEDDKGRILRLALDDCVRKMLPKIDRMLQQRAKVAAASQPNAAAGPDNSAAAMAGTTPTDEVAGAKFCSHCGGKLAVSAKFCAGCGTKVE